MPDASPTPPTPIQKPVIIIDKPTPNNNNLATEKKKKELGPVDIPIGKLVGTRWKVIDKLGEGGCGAVYLVEDQRKGGRAALKAESNFTAGGSVLKLEVAILRKLESKKFVAKLLSAGKKETYCYMVMTLFGPSLHKLFKLCRREFSISTMIRIGVHILYGVKQIHEIGYVHRDLKPANMAVGLTPLDSRIVHLLDFGLAREYVTRGEGGRLEMRRPRENALFRGTTKYCSPSSHRKMDQGRPDDLWSMMYVLAEFRGPLPWEGLRDKHEIGRVKRATTDEKLLAKCPKQMLEITQHLRDLNYFTRPDYGRIFLIFQEIMQDNSVAFHDPMDWELIPASLKTAKCRNKTSRVRTIQEDVSVAKTSMEPTQKDVDPSSKDTFPFTQEEFDKNDIGF